MTSNVAGQEIIGVICEKQWLEIKTSITLNNIILNNI